ncbi:hypothetical protein M413DRAFT_60193 [Hebeloma cylindrosporum]|uniref:Autophagy-related protein 101 n=1 Tax=Hebeloma cylindrosporum TaxID=76867 RepID=A0A0C2Z9M3_HEBCY|nr:hypothetical protein M413DRAFT_60193 [Hebeloma cylindrosporum h7]
MNNSGLPTITIELILDRQTAKDVLKGMLHAIFFHRLFGPIKPQTFEVLDVTIPAVSDQETEQLVDEKVDAFWKGLEGGFSKRGQATCNYSGNKPKKNWFSIGEEEVPWEQWVINAELRQPKTEKGELPITLTRALSNLFYYSDREKARSALASTLTKAIHTMITHTSSEKGRAAVPPITDANTISPFPFKIIVKVDNVEVG